MNELRLIDGYRFPGACNHERVRDAHTLEDDHVPCSDRGGQGDHPQGAH